MLVIRELHKSYRVGHLSVHALRGVSLTIAAGEFVAIMGPSGSGKSTLLHLLGFLDSPDRGALELLGQDVNRLDESGYAQLRSRIVGFVFQQFNLLPRTTALENVALPLFYAAERPSAATQRPQQLLESVGVGDRLLHRPNELSGGQQQRVAIARALVNQPRLLLADEPTGNLDSHSQTEVMQLLTRLNAEGLTIILVTHEEDVAKYARRVIRMRDGRIVSDASRTGPLPPAAPSAMTGPAATALGDLRAPRLTLRHIRQHGRQALRMIRANAVRSALSMLGVLIGVGCVITMLALGRGAQASIREELSRLGSNLLSVRPGSVKVRGVATEAGAVTRLTVADARAIEQSVPSVTRTAPQVTGQAQVVYGNKNWSTRLLGSTPAYAQTRSQRPVRGRFYTAEEETSRRRVVLLGQTVWHELFDKQNPVGETVKINRTEFQVIGVLPSSGANAWRDLDDIVVVPLSTAMYRVLGKEYVDQIDAEVRSPDLLAEAERDIKALIVRRNRLTAEREDTFNIRNYADIQQALASTTKTMSVLLGAVAAISLLVGGIGIMNIMLVSVTERTREIGLRKALGANARDILLQFLVEAVMVTMIGGLSGVALGTGAAWLMSATAGWNTVIDADSILLAFGFSAGVGVVFGLWPARQAAGLDPIRSLRYE